MLQPAGDLGFEQEAGATGGVVGVLLLDLLEGDLTVQLCIQRDRDQPEVAARMRPHDAIAGAFGL